MRSLPCMTQSNLIVSFLSYHAILINYYGSCRVTAIIDDYGRAPSAPTGFVTVTGIITDHGRVGANARH